MNVSKIGFTGNLANAKYSGNNSMTIGKESYKNTDRCVLKVGDKPYTPIEILSIEKKSYESTGKDTTSQRPFNPYKGPLILTYKNLTDGKEYTSDEYVAQAYKILNKNEIAATFDKLETELIELQNAVYLQSKSVTG